MSIRDRTEWIAVDWGTSALRAWAMDARGDVVADASSDDGMGSLAPAQFEPALINLIQDWLPQEHERRAAVIACGMVGARQGWCEAGYHSVPSAALDVPFAEPATVSERITVRIVPGLSQNDPPDVMRGEETQIAGLLHEEPDFDGVACLPGTHTKWARVAGGRVESFRTFMTGEMFKLLTSQSVLRHSLKGEGWDPEAFRQGSADASADPASITAQFFTLRAAALLHDLDPVAACSRLSGLLIGTELAAARSFWNGRRVCLVGNGGMADAYAAALADRGAIAEVMDATAVTLSGLRAAYRLYRGTRA